MKLIEKQKTQETIMRQICTVQSSIFDLFADHEIERELHQMSKWLDQHFELAESVLRCALLKQYQQLSYTELAFHLLNSASFHAF